ncbi:MAG TPA: sigma-70 family RNA polymerase sigma factor [Gammaproteobacteria bacterium]
MAEVNQITQMLNSWRAGDNQALKRLIPLVHDNLHQLANKYMRNESPGHTLQATALVNEAFLKLCDNSISWQSRAHFIAIAARAMRQILVDHAKSKHRQKRGGHDVQVTLHEALIADDQSELDMLDMEEALNNLAKVDERKAKIIEMNIFGGMTYEEIGVVLDISPATVDRELRFSKAWLQRALSDDH